jgi:hypothetical protein
LDSGFEVDLAIAGAREIVILHGRDRKLTLDDAARHSVAAPASTRLSFEFEIASIAIGDFIADRSQQHDIAVVSHAPEDMVLLNRGARHWDRHSAHLSGLPHTAHLLRAKLSSRSGDELLVLDGAGRQFEVLNHAAGTMLSYPLSNAPAALLPMRLNKDALDDLVILAEGSAHPEVILTAPVNTFVVDSTGQDNDCDLNDGVCSIDLDPNTNGCQAGACTFKAALQQANFSPGADEIAFGIGTGLQTIPVVFGGNPSVTETVTIDGSTQPGFSGAPLIELDANGAAGNALHIGIAATNSVVRSLISSNGNGPNAKGLALHGSNCIVEGNYIGTDETGTIARPNGDGISIFGSNNTIGGTTAAARNLISGNTAVGIGFGGGATANVIAGNYIGTDVTGSVALGNGREGIHLGGSAATVSGNLIAGNNTANSNTSAGLDTGGGDGTLVQGNRIGVNAAGTAALADPKSGVSVAGSNTTIGGTTPAARNVISGNGLHGVHLANGFSSGNLVQGNYIGTNAAGTIAIANALNGIECGGKGDVGGTAAGAGNVISGNGQDGIGLSTVFGTTIQGNLIGTQADGVSALGNARTGVRRNSGTGLIGGTAAGAANVIAFNGGDGIVALNGAIASGNSIHSNADLGIDYNDDGVTLNSGCSVNNFPVITAASTTGTRIRVSGTLSASPNSNYTLDFFASSSCDAAGHGEGAVHLGTALVTTDGACNASFSVTFNRSVPVGSSVTATSSPGDLAGNGTSEFSLCTTARRRRSS